MPRHKLPSVDVSWYDTQGRFIFRYDAEENPSFQQLIPYVILTSQDRSHYYISKRITGDHRLKGKLSLGFGGHIGTEDGYTDVIRSAMHRELKEEVYAELAGEPEFIGHVRDLKGKTPDHLGFVYTAPVKSVKIREDNVLEGHWMSLEQLVESYYQFENWGRFIIDHLYEENA